MPRITKVTLVLLISGLFGVFLGLWIAPAGHLGPPVGFAIFATILMYNLWRRRSPRKVLRLSLVYGLPVLVTLVMLLGNSGQVKWAMVLSFASASAFGAAFGSLVEIVSGRRRPAVVRAQWQNTSMVGADTGDVPVVFDIRPLTMKLSKKDVRARRSAYPRDPRGPGMFAQKTLFLVGWPLIAILIPIAFTDEKYVTGPDATSQILGMAAMFSLLILAYVIFGVMGTRGWRQLTSTEEHIRLHAFADLNGFSYVPGPVSGPDGSILTRVMQSENGWLLANGAKPQEQVNDSVAPTTKFFGVVEYQLPHGLPHIFMRRTGLRAPAFSESRTPVATQRLRLEGDFDRYYETYCPKNYERDALYLFTPDVLIALIDGARDFDIEIIDNRLIFRSRSDVVTTDPAVWHTIARVVSALAGRARHWMMWRDDRHVLDTEHVRLISEVPTGAAKAGQRLRGSLSLGALLIGAYAVLFVLLTYLSNTLPTG